MIVSANVFEGQSSNTSKPFYTRLQVPNRRRIFRLIRSYENGLWSNNFECSLAELQPIPKPDGATSWGGEARRGALSQVSQADYCVHENIR
jgi:hypothetical protein